MSEEEKRASEAQRETEPVTETPEGPSDEVMSTSPAEENTSGEAASTDSDTSTSETTPIETAPEPAEEPAPTQTQSPESSSPAETPNETADEQEEASTATEETATPESVAASALTIAKEAVRPGMTVRIHERIKDISPKGEERERVQIFEGMVLGMRGAGVSRTMTIRRVQKGYGVEKIYPLALPAIVKIELVKQAKVRRAKLSFLSDLRHRFKRKFKETSMS